MACCLPRLHQFDEDLFCLADDEHVEEVGDGFGVEGAVPAADDQRMCRVAVGAADRQPCQVEEFEGVGEELFVGGADREDVETGDGTVALQRIERDAAPSRIWAIISGAGRYVRSARTSGWLLRMS